MTDDPPTGAPPAEVIAATFRQGPVGSQYELASEFADVIQGQFVPTPGRVWRSYAAGIWTPCDGDVVKSRLWGWLQERCRAKGGATDRLVGGVYSALCVMDGFWRQAEEFDADADFMVFRNGVVRLSTGEVFDHDPRHLSTFGKPFDYDPEATCPRWERFLAQVYAPDGATPWEPFSEWEPDAQLLAMTQEWFGYVLSHERCAQKALLIHGPGQTGKGIVVKVLSRLVGPQFVASIDLSRLDEEYHIGSTIGKRLAISTEFPTSRMIADAQFKALVGGDMMQGRLPYGRPQDFMPTVALTVTCNRMPATSDTSSGYYRRLMLQPTYHRIPDESVVRDFDRTFDDELPGIFNWAWRGYERLRAAGFAFTSSDSSNRELAAYRLESDSVAEWASQCVVEDQVARERVDRLFESYTRYCRENGRTPVCSVQMSKRLRDVFTGCRVGDRAKIDGTVRRVVSGVRLPSDEER